MVLSYKDLQRKLKIQRDLGNIRKNFRLNQRKDVLEARLNRVKNRKARVIQRNRVLLNRYKFKDGKPKKIRLGNYFTLKNLIEEMPRPRDKNAILQVGDFHYMITEKTAPKLLSAFGTNQDEIYLNQVDLNEYGGSDVILFQKLLTDPNAPVSLLYESKGKKRKQEGAFFPYTHNIDIDLSRYQIFNEVKSENYNENCFIYALKMSGLTDSVVDTIKSYCKSDHIPQKYFKQFANEHDLCIEVKRLQSCGKIRINKYGNGSTKINLGLLAEHYFLIEPVNITKYAITNYDDVRHLEDWNVYTKEGERIRKRDRSCIDSFEVVRTLLNCKDKRLTVIDNCLEIMKSPAHIHVDDKFTTLNYDVESNTNLVEYKEKETKHDHVVYFDFETTTDGHFHVPYLISYTQGDLIKSSRNKYDFLESLEDNTLCYAHNLGYDFRFLVPCLYKHKIIQKSASKVIHLTGVYYKRNKEKINLAFKCSYAMTDSRLSLFPEIFGFTGIKKEILPYNVYTQASVLKEKIKVSDALKYIEDCDKDEFLHNLDEWSVRDGDYFDHMMYSQLYCEQDVRVTKRGFEQFRDMIMEITGLDIYNHLTLASVADEFFKKEGCYDGCYELTGIPRRFIQKCVRGGRTMTRKNEMINVKGKFSDFDGVSLYPSAIERLGGFLLGVPKVVTNTNYDDLKTKTSYFVEVNITNVGKYRDFPLINRKMENGVIQYDNDIRGTIYLDKIGLEDLIEFQDVEFDVIKGYYFDEGRNTKSVEMIQYLFNERLKMKKLKNPIQRVYKLLMNSCYGKTCLKEIPDEVKIMSEKDFIVFKKENCNQLNYWRTVNAGNRTLYIVKSTKSVDKHYNRCHIGTEILSTSKRIMNEVMCTAEDLGLKLYYQDTDSMHIDFDKIDLLANTYRSRYNRELIGKQLGQFHSDFDFKSEKDVYAEESIFLGKKSYIDKVVLFKKKEGVEYDDEVDYPEEAYDKVYDYHIRLKGIPTSVIDTKIKEEYEGDSFALYKDMYEHQAVAFNLLNTGKKNVACFEANTNYEIRNRSEFNRVLVFGN